MEQHQQASSSSSFKDMPSPSSADPRQPLAQRTPQPPELVKMEAGIMSPSEPFGSHVYCPEPTQFDLSLMPSQSNESGSNAYMSPESQPGTHWPRPKDEYEHYALHSSPTATAFPHVYSANSSPRSWSSADQYCKPWDNNDVYRSSYPYPSKESSSYPMPTSYPNPAPSYLPSQGQHLPSSYPPTPVNDSDDGMGRHGSPRPAQKQEEPYAQLICRAFLSTERHAMTLQEIYQWFRENTAKGKSATKGWQNSIRHNLSMNQAFTKRDRPPPPTPTPTPDGSISEKDKSKPTTTEWYLEPWAVKEGVQSTTRYRKGTPSRRAKKPVRKAACTSMKTPYSHPHQLHSSHRHQHQQKVYGYERYEWDDEPVTPVSYTVHAHAHAHGVEYPVPQVMGYGVGWEDVEYGY
ncbi:hypothetical protein OQA88_3463 [Cercophora sp. LCS_1]